MRIASVVVLLAVAACSPGVGRGGDPPPPVTDALLPQANDIGAGWARVPGPAPSGPVGRGAVCEGAEEIWDERITSGEPTWVLGEYTSRAGLLGVRIEGHSSRQAASRWARRESDASRACGERFTYVTSDGTRLPATTEVVSAGYQDVSCERFSLVDGDETGWFATCRATSGRVVVWANTLGERDEVVPRAARVVDLTRRRVEEQGVT